MNAPVAVGGAVPGGSSSGGAALGMVMPYSPPVITDQLQQNYYKDVGRDKFEHAEENPVKQAVADPVSTFSIDVDTASYAFTRKMLNQGVLPQKDAVRPEEMINYFPYSYPAADAKDQPFRPTVAVYDAPWKKGDKLVHIGIKGYDVAPAEKPHSNLVFLLDVSGSMNSPDKLPLVKNSLKMLLDNLKPDDTIGIVVYAGSAGTVLEPTKVAEKQKIIDALDRLEAGGSTAGAEGIRQAYNLAQANFDKNGVNRVILATDGDFNVGITDQNELKSFIERERDTGIFLSVLGFGDGNYQDAMMQTLAQNGNGVAAYIDTLSEARKVLAQEASSTLFTIAKDVKIQVEFNPATVKEYRLIGYETRHLNREDFNNDKVDAGDIGAGHAVTAIYEITPADGQPLVDALRYGEKPAVEDRKVEDKKTAGNEYAFLKIRYKLPNEDTSRLITQPVTTAQEVAFDKASDDTRFATAVAGFAELLKGSKYTGTLTYDQVISMADGARGRDEFGYRTEFTNLVRLAKSSAAMAPQ
jgi:Ca-activated chloride channel family protein